MSILPLQGTTVADFSQVWAGPILALLLADMGASVVRIESQAGTDARRLPTREISDYERRMESLYFFRNRRAYITLKLSDPRGADLAKQIVSRSDVVVENFAATVMEKFGLGYEDLRKVKPDLVMISISAAGHTGPLKDLLGYGPSINSLVGTDSLIGYSGERELMANIWDADPTAGTMGALAVLMALWRKRRTGKGQYIDLSFMETLGTLLGEGLMEYQMTGRVPAPRGNFHPTMAPHNFFRCQGEDSWVSIAIKTQREWTSFCHAIGDPPWTKERRFADQRSRMGHRQELEAMVSEWTAGRTAEEATRVLQAAGVAAAPAYTVPELYHDPHWTYRRTKMSVEAPGITPDEINYGPQWHLSATPSTIRRAAPPMGADNERYFTTVLGLPAAEVQRLIEEKVIY